MRACRLTANLLAGLVFAPALASAKDPVAGSRIAPRSTEGSALPATPNWSARIARIDRGSQNEAWAQTSFDHRGWKTMKLPAHWEQAGLPDYDGVVWFRRTVEVSETLARSGAVLSLGAIDDMDVTWVNGKRVGGYERPGDHFTPRNYKIPTGLLVPGRNVIAVRVMDHGYGGGLAQTHGRMQLNGGGQSIPLTGPWHYRPGASLAQLLRAEGKAPAETASQEPFRGAFELRSGDVIAFAGGSTMVKQMESGYLEAILGTITSHPVYFRDVAWQADTVYRQQRPRNFGSHLDLLGRIKATVIVANFGQMEALEGATRLPQFIAAYEQLLDQFARQTPRIILVAPHPFAKPPGLHLPDLSKRNGDVAAYAEAIRQLAARRGYLFVDLAKLDPTGLTTDGLQLNAAGHFAWARHVASQLTGEPVSLPASALDELRPKIARKNALWRRHWRPTNWSFLYGNRQHVPSSHDHRPGQPRWFPKEVNAIIPLIEKAEDDIHAHLKSAR